MRLTWLLLAGLTLVFAAPADAARRRRPVKPKNEPLDIVVLPFGALSGKKATEAKEALELELELVDNARVVAADTVLADIDDAGAEAFSPAVLSRILKKRGIEVLVATPPSMTSSTGKPLVVAWAADGLPRAFREVAAGASVDQIAATTLSFLKPALVKWKTSPAVKLPAPSRVADDDDDVLRGGSDDEDEPPKKPSRRDPNPPIVSNPKDPSDANDRRRPVARSIDDDEDDTARKRAARAADEEEEARARRRSRVVDDDEDAAPRRRRAAIDETDVGGLEGERRSLLDVEDDLAAGGGTVKDHHLIAVSGTFDGATWYYNFEGNDGVQPDAVQAGFYPGGSARADLWLFPWLGVDASASLAAVQFQINSNANLTITPNKFVSWHTHGGAALKARYLVRFADEGVVRLIGIGGRLGYRYWGASVEQQIVNGSAETLTVVPGFQLHSLAVGPELYLPLFVGDRRFELELKVDTLPATFYSEQPDNPGGSSLAFGYDAELLLRFDLFGGFFVEAVGKSTGLTINFEGEGDRVTVVGGNNQLVSLKGGRSVNVAAGGSLGVGFMF
ncbi:MAG: hypothetical protein Q8O67_09660 [Deltaproteobacteria bacterium]|nr:hypothetical protein [Deltaproteobacteria bacterium]